MKAGKLRHKVDIEHKTNVEEDLGGVSEEWALFAKNRWASIEALRGRELFTAQQVNSEVTYKITMRYLPGIVPDMRIHYKGDYYSILYVINIEERNVTLELMCSKGLKNV